MYKHGWFGTSLYYAWAAMKRRCLNPNHRFYCRYGGRGITVCVEWMEFVPFKEWALSNGYETGKTLDRTDNDGNYCPQNCRWTTQKVQMNNTSCNRILEYGGIAKNLTQWSVDIGIDRRTLRARIFKQGWSLERALTEPLHSKYGKRKIG